MKGFMQPMRRGLSLAFSLAAALAVSACSETAMQDLLGSGKDSAPDASQVTVGQNLSMPPDLQLRAPTEGSTNDNQALAPPVQPVEPAATTATAQAVPKPLTGTQTAAAEPPKQDVYERYGISKTGPDGKPKSQGELYKELHEAQLAEKRRANPNYGTIWNLGNIFSDD
jgi:hypothetical protein